MRLPSILNRWRVWPRLIFRELTVLGECSSYGAFRSSAASLSNKRQHTAPAALDSQQVARLCGGRYA